MDATSKKTKGTQNEFRMRVGKFRILFKKNKEIITIKRIKSRNERTYKD
jgi:mRNA-degrading endonuclease RelE of RelBE toxin-antitoxin system